MLAFTLTSHIRMSRRRLHQNLLNPNGIAVELRLCDDFATEKHLDLVNSVQYNGLNYSSGDFVYASSGTASWLLRDD